MKVFLVLPFLISVLILSGCEKVDNEFSQADIEYINYGTSFGMCLGYCNNGIHITDSEIEFLATGWESEGQLPDISKSVSVEAEYWNDLVKMIETQSFMDLDTIIGCPDCADGGAEWIEIHSKGKIHKVTFEYQNEPKEVSGYIAYLRTYLNAFQTSSINEIDFNSRVLTDQEGFVKNFVATRGSYQWLIGIVNNADTTYYFDNYLNNNFLTTNEYRLDNLKIEFNGVLQDDSTQIFKPAPNDIPVQDFKARNINTFGINIISD